MPVDDQLPIEVAPAAVRRCWYCGESEGRFEKEHQLPRSRGGRGRRMSGKQTTHTRIVWACEACNDVKGALDVSAFRAGLAQRLGIEPEALVFHGEATVTRPATAFQDARSLLGSRAVVRIDPFVAAELDDAVAFLTAVGERQTKKEFTSEILAAGLQSLRLARFGSADSEWPTADSLTLFPVAEDEDGRPRVVVGRSALPHLPRVVQPRELTKVPGEDLDAARRMVTWRQENGSPLLTLVEWMGQAVREKLARDAEALPGAPRE